MPYKEKKIEKLYYSISEIADMFSVSQSLIRYWESEFEVLNPRKNGKGNRMFTQKDIGHFRKIYDLVKEKGFTLEGARKKLKDGDEPENLELGEIVKKLKEIKTFLTQLDELL
ncbi:MAG: MerR family transcriptional regulator [Bacteroidetes bacterium]|nr:MerR family transcriptional regulator [Bacteroidota bacterium]MBK7138374.1 MerR family transcriptional regulator [Bacteroidota bacterium]MBK7505793.1 MerR family transcriptional regulator [Bacteroidota bacterium]MBK7639936.1 MerR family transcriptional regulator [Bacteroidota bacterium]MBK8671722.1 MerR family transcriptional regulator [Bacteroidota bacterium]